MYKDNYDVEYEIFVCDGKLLDVNFLFIFIYKVEEYVVYKILFGMGKLLWKGYVIVDWNICFEEDMYYIEMNVYDEDYM